MVSSSSSVSASSAHSQLAGVAKPPSSSSSRDDEQAHLEAPVAEMRVAPDLVAAKAEHALDAFADDRRAQMARHACPWRRSGRHNRRRRGVGRGERSRRRADRRRWPARASSARVGDREVEEARTGDRRRWRRSWRRRRAGDDASAISRGGLPAGLGRGQRAVALEVAEVRPVGAAHCAQTPASSPARRTPPRELRDRDVGEICHDALQ